MRPEPPIDHDLSLVIPAFNESHRLAATLDQLVGWLANRGTTFEILVVDDGSSDATSAIAEAFSARGVRLLRHQHNRGKGAAVRTGVAASRGHVVLISDADLSTPIDELLRLEPHLRSHPIVIGSREAAEANIVAAQSRLRVLLGRLFNRFVQVTTLPGVRDTQCGFKLIHGDVARELFDSVLTNGFAFDVEFLWLARSKGHAIAEVGVTWIHDSASTVRPWRDGMTMLASIVQFRLAHGLRSTRWPRLSNALGR